MRDALLANAEIQVTKTWFGLSEKAVYVPTGSKAVAKRHYCSPEDGRFIEELLQLPDGQVAAKVKNHQPIKEVAIGNQIFEVCYSEDGAFVALQLFRFADFKYWPVSSARFFTNDVASALMPVFAV